MAFNWGDIASGALNFFTGGGGGQPFGTGGNQAGASRPYMYPDITFGMGRRGG